MSITDIPLLTAESLKVQRGKGKDAKLILNGNPKCTFSIEMGKLYYLAGPSGAGKSTLLSALARLYPIAGGILRFHNIRHTKIPIAHWRTEIALLPQSPVIISDTIANNLLYPLHSFRRQKERLNERHESLPDNKALQKELNSVGLEQIPLEREAISLSGGQIARLALIRVLLTKPKLILADEPIAGVDEVAAELVFNRLSQFCEQGGAVILTSHAYSDRIGSTQIVLDGKGMLLIK